MITKLREAGESVQHDCVHVQRRSLTNLQWCSDHSRYECPRGSSHRQSSVEALASSTRARSETLRVQEPCRVRCNEAATRMRPGRNPELKDCLRLKVFVVSMRKCFRCRRGDERFRAHSICQEWDALLNCQQGNH